MTSLHFIGKLTAAVIACCLCGIAVADERQHVVVAVGAGGTDEYQQMFSQWADLWENAAAAGEADVNVVGRDGNHDSAQQFRQKVSEAATVSTPEPLWIVFIGHGTFDGRAARFNFSGPDLSAVELAELLASAKRPVAVINCSSCSAPFINELSGPNRIIISATKDGSEIQFTRFGGYLAEAVGTLDADTDRDGQTSLLEAWLFAARRTEEYYRADGRIATEHSLLDDNGDAKGTRVESFEGVRVRESVRNKESLDGKLARRWHLVRSESERSLTAQQRSQRDRLEDQLEQLRRRKTEFSEADYLTELEKILVPLATLYEQAGETHTRN